MRLNPEFRRYLWLEASPQRLIAMPVILAAVFFLVSLSDDTPNRVSSFGFGVYFLLVLLWGTRLAASSVVAEVRDGTWDWQRMSAIGPWQMTWGKLFGSTIFVWYGALIALAVGIADWAFRDDAEAVLTMLFLCLASGVLAHAVSLGASLLWLRRGARESRVVLVMPQLLGLLAGGWAGQSAIFSTLDQGSFLVRQNWYGFSFEQSEFVLVSLAIFLLWSILGAYRLMQAELQIRQRPWAWAVFVLFVTFYFSGIPELRAAKASFAGLLFARLLLGFAVALCMAYLSIFLFQKDPIGLRGLSLAFRSGDVRRALRLLPLWLIAVVIVELAGLALIVVLASLSEASEVTRWQFDIDSRLAGTFLVVGTIGFLLRDLAIVLFLNLRGTSKRADAAALIYLLVLHLLIPGLLLGTELEVLVGLVSPLAHMGWLLLDNVVLAGMTSDFFVARALAMDSAPWTVLGGGAVQAVLVFLLLFGRWRRFQSDFETSLAHEGV